MTNVSEKEVTVDAFEHKLLLEDSARLQWLADRMQLASVDTWAAIGLPVAATLEDAIDRAMAAERM